MSEWKIARRRDVCSACERPFDEGERHVSTLRVAAEGLERAELCTAWWNRTTDGCRSEACAAACAERADAGQGSDEDAVSGTDPEDLFYWFTRHEAARKTTVRLDLESLERLFLELEGRDELPLRELRYVVCLILMRKRRLKLEKVERVGDDESFLVKRPRHEERYRVFAFDFDADRTAEVRHQLQAIFDGAEGDDTLERAVSGGPEEAEDTGDTDGSCSNDEQPDASEPAEPESETAST